LPAITLAETLDTPHIHRDARGTEGRAALVTMRPFRAPPYTIADVGLIGGDQVPTPGEVSLAHHGVLFLDELPEFRRHVLEVLRQPLEDGVVTIAWASMSVIFPVRGSRRPTISNHATPWRAEGIRLDPFSPLPRREIPGAEQPTLDRLLSRGKIHIAEAHLRDFGFYPGLVNGLLTAETQAAVRAFQTRYGLAVSGRLHRRKP
jgi:magnesium chelatase family protein